MTMSALISHRLLENKPVVCNQVIYTPAGPTPIFTIPQLVNAVRLLNVEGGDFDILISHGYKSVTVVSASSPMSMCDTMRISDDGTVCYDGWSFLCFPC